MVLVYDEDGGGDVVDSIAVVVVVSDVAETVGC
jgi:hypothetical protein